MTDVAEHRWIGVAAAAAFAGGFLLLYAEVLRALMRDWATDENYSHGFLNLPVSGGGYFRILPYAWTRWSIGHVSRFEQRPIVFYLHPWEIDPGQPRLVAGRLGRFRHYRNLSVTEARLRRLMTEFRFETVSSLVCRASAQAPARTLATCLPYLW